MRHRPPAETITLIAAATKEANSRGTRQSISNLPKSRQSLLSRNSRSFARRTPSIVQPSANLSRRAAAQRRVAIPELSFQPRRVRAVQQSGRIALYACAGDRQTGPHTPSRNQGVERRNHRGRDSTRRDQTAILANISLVIVRSRDAAPQSETPCRRSCRTRLRRSATLPPCVR